MANYININFNNSRALRMIAVVGLTAGTGLNLEQPQPQLQQGDAGVHALKLSLNKRKRGGLEAEAQPDHQVDDRCDELEDLMGDFFKSPISLRRHDLSDRLDKKGNLLPSEKPTVSAYIGPEAILGESTGVETYELDTLIKWLRAEKRRVPDAKYWTTPNTRHPVHRGLLDELELHVGAVLTYPLDGIFRKSKYPTNIGLNDRLARCGAATVSLVDAVGPSVSSDLDEAGHLAFKDFLMKNMDEEHTLKAKEDFEKALKLAENKKLAGEAWEYCLTHDVKTGYRRSPHDVMQRLPEAKERFPNMSPTNALNKLIDEECEKELNAFNAAKAAWEVHPGRFLVEADV